MPRRISEELTRKEMIDPQLEKAGWYLRDHSRVKTEIPVDGYDAEPWNGVSDYTLYHANEEKLGIFLQKLHIKIAYLYEVPLSMFSAGE